MKKYGHYQIFWWNGEKKFYTFTGNFHFNIKILHHDLNKFCSQDSQRATFRNGQSIKIRLGSSRDVGTKNKPAPPNPLHHPSPATLWLSEIQGDVTCTNTSMSNKEDHFPYQRGFNLSTTFLLTDIYFLMIDRKWGCIELYFIILCITTNCFVYLCIIF